MTCAISDRRPKLRVFVCGGAMPQSVTWRPRLLSRCAWLGGWLRAFDEAQAVFELGDAELQLLQVRLRHEAELPEQALSGRARTADPLRFRTPTTRELVDERARVVSFHPTAGDQGVDKCVHALGGE